MNPFRRLMEVLAGDSPGDLRRQLQYLKAENEVLRAKIAGPVKVTRQERARLVRLGKGLGSAIAALVTIVRPETFAKWVREAGRKPRPRPRAKVGRPRKPEETRQLVLRLARETGWGFTRLLGELRKLGVTVSRGTIVNILREAGLPTGPSRSESTWDQFLRAHAKTLWACDFMSWRVVTPKGVKDAFVLLFMHVASRRVIASPSTQHPNAEWVDEQVAAFSERGKGGGGPRCRILVHDRDSKFGRPFRNALQSVGIASQRLPQRAPNMNAHVERFIQTLQVECLEKFIVLGTRHMDYLVAEFVTHYNTERPHSSLEFRPPAAPTSTRAPPTLTGRVRCRTRLGGVLKHFYRAA